MQGLLGLGLIVCFIVARFTIGASGGPPGGVGLGLGLGLGRELLELTLRVLHVVHRVALGWVASTSSRSTMTFQALPLSLSPPW